MKRRKTTGFILAGVLLLLALMTFVTAVGARNSRIDSRVSLLGIEKIRCKWLSRAGFETAKAMLSEDQTATDDLTESWAGGDEMLENVALEGGSYDVKITDESSKLNVNTATKEQLVAIDGLTEQIADAILDWRDRDDEQRTYGAENGYYQNLTYPYQCRNGSFRTLRELLLVRGITPQMLYGQEDSYAVGQDGWSRFLTCYSGYNNVDGLGNERVNVNEADQNKLKMQLGITDSQAKWIVEHRSFRTMADLIDKNKQAASSSQGGGQNQAGSSLASGGNNATEQKQQSEPPDWDTFVRILDKITLSNRKFLTGAVNVNTAGQEVLEAMLGADDRQLAIAIVQKRQQRGGAYAGLGELMEVEAMTKEKLAKLADVLSLRTGVFTIKSDGISKVSGLRTCTEAVIRRQTGQSPRILYWLQGVGH